MKTLRKRRKQNKTDYKARLGMLKSEKPRLVIRKTNKHIITQIVVSEIAQDKVVAEVNSKALLSLGWPKEKSGSLKSLPAAYLTGLLLGSKTEIKEAILDLGLQRNIHKSRLYAALKGAIDSGLSIAHSKEALPSDEVVQGSDELKAVVEKVKASIGGKK